MVFTLRDLPKIERPRERLLNFGSQALSLHELLQIIVTSGSRVIPVYDVCQNILKKFGTLDDLYSASIEELKEVKGLGIVKAIQIKAALELGKRMYLEENNLIKSDPILDSGSAFKLAYYHLKDKKKEHLLLFCLNTRGKLLVNPEVISIGTLDGSLIHPREVFNIAIKNRAAAIMLAHNHPSGNTSPSDQDLLVTRHIFDAGKLIKIQLLDHLIVAGNDYLSIREYKPDLFV